MTPKQAKIYRTSTHLYSAYATIFKTDPTHSVCFFLNFFKYTKIEHYEVSLLPLILPPIKILIFSNVLYRQIIELLSLCHIKRNNHFSQLLVQIFLLNFRKTKSMKYHFQTKGKKTPLQGIFLGNGKRIYKLVIFLSFFLRVISLSNTCE